MVSLAHRLQAPAIKRPFLNRSITQFDCAVLDYAALRILIIVSGAIHDRHPWRCLRTPWAGRLSGQGRCPTLGVIVFDPAAIVGVAANTTAATAPRAATRRRLFVTTTHANTEKHRSKEESCPRAPGKAEGVGADLGRAVVRVEGVASKDECGTRKVSDGTICIGGCDIRHQRHCERREEKSDEGDEARDGSAQAATTGKEAGEEGQDLKEEGDKNEDPGEPPHVEELGRRGVAAMAADKLRGRIVGARVPGTTKGRCRMGAATVLVVGSAEVEICPLSGGARTRDALGIGAQEVGLVEGRRVGDAGKNDEE